MSIEALEAFYQERRQEAGPVFLFDLHKEDGSFMEEQQDCRRA